MRKPTPVQRKALLEYEDIIAFVEKKYDIDTRDYAGKHNGKGGESHFQKYERITGDVVSHLFYPDCSGRNGGKTVMRNGKKRPATEEEYRADFDLIHKQYQRYLKWCKKNPENEPPPYLDYWHWIIENQFDSPSEGTEQYWDLKDILEDETTPDWVKDITQKVYDEFKEYVDESGGIEVLV